MPEEAKKSGMIAQIMVAVVIALCVGGSSPWWFKELFITPKPEPAAVEASRLSATTPGYGQTAVGEGSISGRDVSITVQTALGSQGTLRMTLSDDGRQMSGTYSDQTFGTETPYSLTR